MAIYDQRSDAKRVLVADAHDRVAASLTRLANTTTYTAGTVVAATGPANFTFPNVGRDPGTGGVIRSAVLMSNAWQSTPAFQGSLWLFGGNAAPAAIADNAAVSLSDAELANLIGKIDFTLAAVNPTAGAGGNAVAIGTVGAGLLVPTYPFRCGAATSSLFGILTVANAYVPVSAEVFTITLGVQRD